METFQKRAIDRMFAGKQWQPTANDYVMELPIEKQIEKGKQWYDDENAFTRRHDNYVLMTAKQL
jgi:hypothetical protein